jgi:predicted AAA+ superfamily ATPase
MDNYFPRMLEPALQSAADQFPVVVLTGARQSGKTSVLRHLFEATHGYVNLDDPDQRYFALDDPRSFLNANPAPLILDEIQHVPQLLTYIKLAVEQDRDACGRYLLTGSQSFALMHGVSESLAGRCAILRLFSLSTAENPLRRCAPVVDRQTYADWILTGSFPELHRRPQIETATWYSSYRQTYLERDVRTLANVGNLRDFDRLMTLLAVRTGAQLNMSELARELGVAVNTVKSWISVLEAGDQVFLCPPYYNSFGQRIIKRPRLHLTDASQAARMTGMISPDQVLRGPLSGRLFESFVGGELLRMTANSGGQPVLYHWRTHSGHEVDFVLEHQGLIHPVECKLTTSPSRKHVAGLLRFREIIPNDRLGVPLLACTRELGGSMEGTRVLSLKALSSAKTIAELLG